MKYSKLEQQIVNNLNSNNVKSIFDALDEVRKNGHTSLLNVVIEHYAQSSNEDVRYKIERMITDLRDKSAVDAITKGIVQIQDNENLSKLICACWQNGLEFGSNLDPFFYIFLNHDYLTAIEAFTLIESNVSACTPNQITEYTNQLKHGVIDVTEEKKPLVKELIYSLQDINKNAG